MKYRNPVGHVIRKLRNQRELSQRDLTRKLQIAGLDTTRSAVAKIEARMIGVCAFELPYYSKVLGVKIDELYPKHDPTKSLHDHMTELRTKKPKGPALLSTMIIKGARREDGKTGQDQRIRIYPPHGMPDDGTRGFPMALSPSSPSMVPPASAKTTARVGRKQMSAKN